MLFVTVLARTLLVASYKKHNHSNLSQKGNVLVHIAAADEERWPRAHLEPELHTALLGLLISCFFFLSHSLSLWVPQGGGGGEWPPAVLGI